MREYFKTTSISPEIKEFREFCKKNGADFIEGEGTEIIGYWIIPKQYGKDKVAIAFKKSDGFTYFRKIVEGCQNFEKFFKEELVWMRKIFEKLEKWNGSTENQT